jgi:hypothetical protein
MKKFTARLFAVLTAIAITGCATEGTNPSKPADPNAWQKDKDLQRVWLAPGFDFNGYDAIYIGETKFAGKERPNEVDIRNWAIKYVRSQFAAELSRVGIVRAVYTETNSIPSGAKVLTLDDTITEYEKGGGGARYFAGGYGAGQPVIRVRGIMSANGQPVFRFEAFRKGESGSARIFGGFRSDEGIQTEDINDLARDLADYISRASRHVSK